MESVDYEYQAAMLKQVFSCEFFPSEAVWTNIFDAINVVNAAIDSGLDIIMYLSTE